MTRRDLVGKRIVDKATEAEIENDQFDEITEQVLNYLGATPVERWTKEQWTTYQTILKLRKGIKEKTKQTTTIPAMSSEEASNYLRGNPSMQSDSTGNS